MGTLLQRSTTETALAPLLRRLAGSLNAGRALLFFDIDGSLSWKVSEAHQAVIGDDVRRSLNTLARVSRHPLIFLTGSSPERAEKMLGLDRNYRIVGLYGMAVKEADREVVLDPDLESVMPVLDEIIRWEDARRPWRRDFITVERKRLYALHYRPALDAALSPGEHQHVLDHALRRLKEFSDAVGRLGPLAINGKEISLVTLPGDKVMDLTAHFGRDKRTFVREAFARHPEVDYGVFGGDDRADIPVAEEFAKLPGSVTFCVLTPGDPRATPAGLRRKANYVLQDPDHWAQVLELMARAVAAA